MAVVGPLAAALFEDAASPERVVEKDLIALARSLAAAAAEMLPDLDFDSGDCHSNLEEMVQQEHLSPQLVHQIYPQLEM